LNRTAIVLRGVRKAIGAGRRARVLTGDQARRRYETENHEKPDFSAGFHRASLRGSFSEWFRLRQRVRLPGALNAGGSA